MNNFFTALTFLRLDLACMDHRFGKGEDPDPDYEYEIGTPAAGALNAVLSRSRHISDNR